MKTNLIEKLFGVGRVCCMVLLCLGAGSCNHDDRSDMKHDHSAHHESEEEGEEKHGNGHDSDEIILMPEVAARMGVVCDTVRKGEFSETIPVGGEITSAPSSQATVTAPTSGVVTLVSGVAEGSKVSRGQTVATISAKDITGGDNNAAALANLNAAKRELDRVTPLHADGIVSTRDYNAVLQAYESAKAAYSPSAASGRATAPISGTVTRLFVTPGTYVNAGDAIADISSVTTLTLRADLPDRRARAINRIKDANFRTAYSDEWYNVGQMKGKVSAAVGGSGTASGPGYSPIYFTFDNPGNIVPGTYAEVTLLGEPREGVISIPTEALSEQQGTLFVYVKKDDHGYEKRSVKAGSNDGILTEVLSGLAPGEIIVTKGATIVKLAESSGIVPEGHSHNH